MVESAPVGLLTAEGAAVPLQGVRVEARLRATASEVTVAQRYRNDGSEPIEAVYVFPLPTGAAVYSFSVQRGERLLVGEARARDEAFEAYDEALVQGHSAYLLDQERPNLFTASVGNFGPGEEAELRLAYVAELDWEGEAVRFVLPTTVAPRYVSEAEQDRPQVGQPEWERVTPPTLGAVPYRLELTVDVDLGAPLRQVSSPSHPLEVTQDGGTAQIGLGAGTTELDRDFVLLLTPQDEVPLVAVEREEDGTVTAQVSYRPEVEVEPEPQEVVFVIDCSGSMGGSSIAEAKAALRLCLRQLEPDSAFNVVRFGSEHELLWPAPREYDEASFAAAEAYVEAMDADLGGTEILAPLRVVLGTPRGERPRVVLLLTDGEVSNDDEVIALVGRHRRDTRIFTFGIGMGGNEHLCRGVASASGGCAEFIHPGERIEPKVLRQFGRLSRPPLELTVEGDAQVTPDPLPPVYEGDRLSCYLSWPRSAPEAVTLAAGTWRWTVPLPAPQPGRLLATLAARAQIEALEQATPAHAGSGQAGRRREVNAARIRELALRYGLMSSETSYVVVEERAEGERIEGQARLVQVPVALTRGWGGVAAAPAMPFPTAAPLAFAMLEDTQEALSRSVLDAPAPPAGAAPPSGLEHPIMMLQRPDGSFELSGWLANQANLSLAEAEAAAAALGSGGDTLLATLLALALLEARCADARDIWRQAARKAQRWLKRQGQLRRRVIGGLPADEWVKQRVG